MHDELERLRKRRTVLERERCTPFDTIHAENTWCRKYMHVVQQIDNIEQKMMADLLHNMLGWEYAT